MNRLQKKCLVASTSLHGFLLLLVLFGSAFFVAKEKQIDNPKLRFVPSRFVEDALAGGGGNPKIAPTDDVQKGSPQAPAQVTPPPPQPVQPNPPPPAPRPEVKKTEPKKPDLPAPTPKPVKPEVTKPADKPPPDKPRIDLSELKKVGRTEAEKRKAQQEAEAQEAARQRAAAANAARQKLAQQIGKATETMQRGFASGTKVDVGGPGGEAYANYGALVQAAYDDAWQIAPDLSDDDAVAVVRVTITRDGRVVSARIIERSRSASMNKSVQKALDAVKKLPPFPDFIKEPERSFTIEFNLKAKRLVG